MDGALALPNLEVYSPYRSGPFSAYTKAIFNSVDLPTLRRLSLEHGPEAGGVGHLYNSLIPQLHHLSLSWLHETDVEHLLLLSTSLQSLHCDYWGATEGLAKVLKHISRIAMKDLHFSYTIELDSSGNWETDFDSTEKVKKVMECKDGLNRVRLGFTFIYHREPSEDVCNRALTSWKRIKAEFKSICVKKGIEVVAFDCCFRYGQYLLWQDKVM
jgi:hypothetical protein